MRLIDADALKADVVSWENCYNGFSDTYDKAMIIGTIDEQPTIDAEPVRHGQWKEHPYEREYDVCTNCQTGVKRREYGWNDDGSEWVTEESYEFCPYCGAKMEGERRAE